jgi:flagellin-like hook-associated protein FlgL
MIKLGTNILSQKVQRNLGRATTDLSTTSERLASGMRINKASDDAAGLAIAASLNADTRIFTQGIRNLNDGLSAGNIAEGAMEQLGNIILRIEELSTQSANGTYSDKQRDSLQKEATALVAEWNRILESTSFNGRNLLTGDTRTVLQGGKGSEGTLAVQIGEAQLAGGLEGSGGTGTTRVSTDSAGNEAMGGSSQVTALSADGRYAAFYSAASNLIAGDTNGQTDSFIKDTLTGVITRISTDSSGNQAMGGASFVNAISADGRYVAFESNASNLVAGDTNGQQDSFIKDTVTGVTIRVSTDSAGNQATGGISSVTAISADGRYIAFNSTATNLVAGDTNGQDDSFIKDIITGVTTRISTDSWGNEATGGFSRATALSADGRYIAFWSAATNLVAGDTNGQRDSFIKDTLTGVTTRISTDSSGNQATGGQSIVTAISADGRYAAFRSSATNLVDGDTNAQQDSFIKDTVTGVTTRISTDSSGNQAMGGGSSVTAISADGRYVAFNSSASNLVAGDTNGQFDSFIKDTITGLTTLISTDSSGNQATGVGLNSTVSAISADGRYAALWSNASNFVAGDTNGQTDAFLRDLTKTGVQTLSGVVISNKVSAKVTLDLIQKYRAELIDYRAKIGASTSRISTFVNTLQSSTINYKAASSRITDADITVESSKSVASRIRQEVAASLLSQANQAPQIALSLLRGA